MIISMSMSGIISFLLQIFIGGNMFGNGVFTMISVGCFILLTEWNRKRMKRF